MAARCARRPDIPIHARQLPGLQFALAATGLDHLPQADQLQQSTAQINQSLGTLPEPLRVAIRQMLDEMDKGIDALTVRPARSGR